MNAEIIERDGFKFVVREGTLDEYIVKENAYAHKITLDPEDIWLDVGAHIGTFSVRFAALVKEIHAYEPSKENYDLLLTNITLNHVKENVHPVHAALVGNEDNERLFYLNTKMNTGSHSFMVKRGRIEVTVVCNNINRILMRTKANKIKMDCEGAEYELIKAIDCWERIDEIIFEFDFAKLKDVGVHLKYFEILQILWDAGFHTKHNEDPKNTWHTVVVARKAK